MVEEWLDLCPGDEWQGTPFFEDMDLVQTATAVNGCDSTSIVHIRIDFPTDFAISGAASICEGQSTTLEVGDFAAYQWSTGEATPSIQVENSGVYEVTVTSDNGCMGTDDFEVQAANISADIQTLEPDCQSDNSGRIDVQNIQGGEGPYVLALNGGVFQSTTFFDNLANGSYQLIIQDVNGCEQQSDVVLAGATELVLNLGSDVRLNLGDSLKLSLIANQVLSQIDWSPAEGLSCTDCPDPFVTITKTTTYTVEAMDENGCQAFASISVFVNKDRPVFIPTAFSPNGDGVNDEFSIFAGQGAEKIKRFEIYSRWGELVFEVTDMLPNDINARWDGQFRDREMGAGVFAWVAEIEFVDGEVKLLTGEVVLVK